jgi:hypothetical protein
MKKIENHSLSLENATGRVRKTLSEYRFVKPDGTIAWLMVKPFK